MLGPQPGTAAAGSGPGPQLSPQQARAAGPKFRLQPQVGKMGGGPADQRSHPDDAREPPHILVFQVAPVQNL